MITFLFKLLTSILLILSLILTLVGGLYILSVELYWWLDVDVFHRLKRKVRTWAYAEPKRERETLVRLLQVRKGRNKKSRIGFIPNKLRLHKGKDNSQTKEVSNHQAPKKSR